MALVATGIITTVAGNGSLGLFADGVPPISTTLYAPDDVALAPNGSQYIADAYDRRVRMVSPTGIITTVAGIGPIGYPSTDNGEGYDGDGRLATQAHIDIPSALAIDMQDNLYIVDSADSVVRKVTPQGIISTVAGGGNGGGGEAATNAALNDPGQVALDAAGNLYIADTRDSAIRKVTPNGIITTIVGGNGEGYTGDGGPATQAQLWFPAGVALDAFGALYISDLANNVVRKVTPDGIIRTVVGDMSTASNGGYSGDGGPALAAQLNQPGHLAFDGAGDLFICDLGNDVVRKVTPDGTITTVAGRLNPNSTNPKGWIPTVGDGGPATAADLMPSGIAVDHFGNLYIADSLGNRIREVFGVAPNGPPPPSPTVEVPTSTPTRTPSPTATPQRTAVPRPLPTPRPRSTVTVLTAAGGPLLLLRGDHFAPFETVDAYLDHPQNSLGAAQAKFDGRFLLPIVVLQTTYGRHVIVMVGERSHRTVRRGVWVNAGLRIRSRARAGSTVGMLGAGFGAHEPVDIYWDHVSKHPIAQGTSSADGSLVSRSLVLLHVPYASPGLHHVIAIGVHTGARATASLIVQT